MSHSVTVRVRNVVLQMRMPWALTPPGFQRQNERGTILTARLRSIASFCWYIAWVGKVDGAKSVLHLQMIIFFCISLIEDMSYMRCFDKEKARVLYIRSIKFGREMFCVSN